MTRDRILDAAALEIERNGLTQFRVKRVAAEAGISVALLYSYFEDREGLIAATIVHRFRQVLLGQAEIFTTPLKHVTTIAQLRTALEQMISDAQAPELDRARIWYALFFGQIALDGEHALSIGSEEWLRALHLLSDAVVRSESRVDALG